MMQAGYLLAQYLLKKLNASGSAAARNQLAAFVGMATASTIVCILQAGGVAALTVWFGANSAVVGALAGPFGVVGLAVIGAL
ncbi:MAG: hypothetical protein LBI84_04290 [Propionibacteriaceae bacterium]|jgi:hypothetical protein|nr:hypothetical protein [Propionibacteriaceae bacterium]